MANPNSNYSSLYKRYDNDEHDAGNVADAWSIWAHLCDDGRRTGYVNNDLANLYV